MVLDIKDLRMIFPGEDRKPILDIRELSIGDKDEVAMIGRSGCGKTTFLNIVSGVLKPTSGSVEVCGTHIAGLSGSALDAFRARHIGYVFQNLNLLAGYTAYENIEISLRIARMGFSKNEIMQSLESVGLTDSAGKYPHEMSLGQQQRVAVVRAVIKKPEIILADEPTSSLDVENSDKIISLLKERAKILGAALIVVSHENEVIAAFDKKIRFSDINLSGSKEKVDL